MKTIEFKIIRNDSPYFVGAYNGNIDEPTLMLNVEAFIHAYKDEKSWKEMAEGMKDSMLATLTHEFCHAMQQFLDKEFDELEVEKTLELYNPKWNVFKAEDDGEQEPSFSLRQLIEFIREDESSTADELKIKIENLFRPYINWIDAEDQFKADQTLPTLPESDEELNHIENVLATAKRLNCSVQDLRNLDYMTELEITKRIKPTPPFSA